MEATKATALASTLLASRYATLVDTLNLTLRAAQEKKISESREFFEQLIADYPTCGRFWKAYIEQELKYRNYDRVEKLFQRSLIKVLNIDLWKFYLNYVKDTKAKMANYKEKMAQAYDFALEKIGLDVQSYTIWNDYVAFLKSVEAAGSFAENQKITAIRKVYQKGIMNPMVNVDLLWKDYCAFENQINPLIAKRMIEDRSREFTNVRKIAKELENMTKNLDRVAPALAPQGSHEELRQKAFWRKYLEWEKANPLKLEDHAALTKRVMFAYEQCLLALATHADIYYDAASYLQQQSLLMAEKCDAAMSKYYKEEVVALYEKAIKSFMRKNMLIYFAYADFEESCQNHQKVSQIYDRFIEIKEVDPSLCYIQYMRFLRRAEGIRSARAAFKRAREDPRISYHVFVAAASMEYLCTKDQTIAYKIFQLGCKSYGHVVEYILAYIDFVKHMNDEKTMRTVLESVIDAGLIAKERTGDIWHEWFKLESDVGDMDSIGRVEEKRDAIYDALGDLDERTTLFHVDRYRFMNLMPCSPVELRSLGYWDSNHFAHNLHYSASAFEPAKLLRSPFPEKPLGSETAPARPKSRAAARRAAEEERAAEALASLPTPFRNLVKERPGFAEPSTERMLPYKSNTGCLSGLQPLPACGLFLYPSIFSDVIKRLPPPTCFDGPYVAIDEFLAHFSTLSLPDDFDTYYKQKLLNDAAREESATQNVVSNAGKERQTVRGKRGALGGDSKSDDEDAAMNEDEDEDRDAGDLTANTDIYKLRQQKKLIKQS